MQVCWDDGTPILGVEFAKQAGGFDWVLEADFEITKFKTKRVGKNALHTLRVHFPEMPEFIDKESANKLLIYRSYAFAHLDMVAPVWIIPPAICLISNDTIMSSDALAWHSEGQPKNWSSRGLSRFKVACAKVSEVWTSLK